MKEWLFKKALSIVLSLAIRFNRLIFEWLIKNPLLVEVLDRTTDELLKICKEHINKQGAKSMPYVAPKIEKTNIPEFEEWARNRNKRIKPLKPPPLT